MGVQYKHNVGLANRYNTIILVGLGGLGSAIYTQMFRYLKYYEYVIRQENDGQIPEHTKLNIYVFDGDSVDDYDSFVKVDLSTAPHYVESINEDTQYTTYKMSFVSYPPHEEGSALYHGYERMRKANLAEKYAVLNGHYLDIVADLYIDEHFNSDIADKLDELRPQLGRILLIDATDHKRQLAPVYERFLLPTDTRIFAGYDAQDNKFWYTIYINPATEAYSTFSNVYDSVPLSPMHAQVIASTLWFIVAHYDLAGVYDLDYTGSLADDIFKRLDDMVIRVDETGKVIKEVL